MPNSSNYWSQSIEQQGSLSINPRTTLPHLGQIFLGRASTIQMRPIGRLRLEFKTTLNPLTFPLKLHTTRRPKSQSHFIHLLQLLNDGSVRRFQRSFSAYLSILSEASTDTTSNPSSSNIMESTLKCIFYISTVHWPLLALQITPFHRPHPRSACSCSCARDRRGNCGSCLYAIAYRQ